MIRRTLQPFLRKAVRRYPVVTVTGPRQAGKTTLVRAALPSYAYASLEAPDERAFALEDPRGFLSQFRGPVILDEVQRAPEILSYIQVLVDERGTPGRFVLTGSQTFLLLAGVSQSLAGRAAVLHLLPFSLRELTGRPGMSLDSIGRRLPRKRLAPPGDLWTTLFAGFYPRIHDKRIPPMDWLGNYYQTYLERDVRSVLNVGDIESFGRFVRLCAGRNGQLLNLSGLASDCGITHSTAGRWIAVLESSFLVMLLRPHFKNYGKRLVKTPKLYFLDTGLLCYLLGIRSPRELATHSQRGSVFEAFIVGELTKNFQNQGRPASMYFWRSSSGLEIDILLELGEDLIPIEVKSGQTINAEFFEGLNQWRALRQDPEGPAALASGGDTLARRNGVMVYPWYTL